MRYQETEYFQLLFGDQQFLGLWLECARKNGTGKPDAYSTYPLKKSVRTESERKSETGKPGVSLMCQWRVKKDYRGQPKHKYLVEASVG